MATRTSPTRGRPVLLKQPTALPTLVGSALLTEEQWAVGTNDLQEKYDGLVFPGKSDPLNQMPVQKLLFVCSQNKLRSLTAEKLFEGFPLYQVRSVGTQPGARIVVTEGHLGWADLIFCMEKSHLNRLRRKFPEAMQDKRVVCLHIPDEYEFMQLELIDELRAKLAAYVMLPEKARNTWRSNPSFE
jgi:predicted protein tyrosine phosphatase